MINFDKKQALLSNWISLTTPKEYGGVSVMMPDGEYPFTVLHSRLVRYGPTEYVKFRCSYKYNNSIQPELAEIYMCIVGKHAIEGRKCLKSIEDTIGLGVLDDTKLYEGTEFTLRVVNRKINTFRFNQIGAVL